MRAATTLRVILANTMLRAAITVVEHNRRAVMAKELMKRSTGENLGRMTISIGVATLRKADTGQSLIERADRCLYVAKRHGRNRVICKTDYEVSTDGTAEVAQRGLVCVPRRRQLHRLTAAASTGLVWVVEDELGRQLVGLVVHLGPKQEQYGLWIDQDLHTLILDHFVGRVDRLGVLHRVFHAGAAAIFDADANASHGLPRPRHHVLDARRGGIGKSHHLRPGSCHGHRSPR